MKTFLLSFLCATMASSIYAQPKPDRVQNYWPEGKAIVCINGTNRYTRALYGSHTLYRLETSDRPVFATYDKRHNRNIRFWLVTGGQAVALDSMAYCKAAYRGGRRDYTLTDPRWGNGRLNITAIASPNDEKSLWRFSAEGFPVGTRLRFAVAPTVKQAMSKDGDLGIEPRESFEADPTALAIKGECSPNACLELCNDDSTMNVLDDPRVFDNELWQLERLMGTLNFSTPDPYLNTLGSNLLAAADGLWDGSTWLHGCIGWRTPLPGWRAAYVADAVGWSDRAVSHFDAYAKSQVDNVPPIYPHPTQDTANNLARAVEKWGTQMYSNGYICRSPRNNHKMHHYDMNLCYVDELLWHFCYDADTAYMRRLWPVLTRHLAWEKRNWDPDGDHLYDAYCCIWASDALWYNGGAVAHSSAYNYRGNLLAAAIAERIGEDPKPYRDEAEAILKAMNSRLWLSKEGHWAEYQDLMGLKRLHTSAALWSIYTPIDCGACTSEQAWRATEYVERNIPHIPLTFTPAPQAPVVKGQPLYTLATTNWLPYDWSTNNVAHEEVANMALAFFESGRNEAGYRLLKADIMDEMYLGQSPGNFGQISYYDKARSEAYRDFGDNIGITARTIINGLFGIRPDALNGRCVVQPSFPAEWDSASIATPYLTYYYNRKGNHISLKVTQQFSRPLKMVLRYSLGEGRWATAEGNCDSVQVLELDLPQALLAKEKIVRPQPASIDLDKAGLLADRAEGKHLKMVKLPFNANVTDIFRREYLSPRPPYTSLEIPKQGIGQWCLPKRTAEIDDSAFREALQNDVFDTHLGVKFSSPAKGNNIVFVSLWDNDPDSVDIPVRGKARRAWLLMAGSTNNMQSRIANGMVEAVYADGSRDTLQLVNPINWCPIEQEYYLDGLAFTAADKRPYRVQLGGKEPLVSRNLYQVLRLKGITGHASGNVDSAEPNLIPGGAAQILAMPLNPKKKLKKFIIKALSNEVVIGLMGLTLEQ